MGGRSRGEGGGAIVAREGGDARDGGSRCDSQARRLNSRGMQRRSRGRLGWLPRGRGVPFSGVVAGFVSVAAPTSATVAPSEPPVELHVAASQRALSWNAAGSAFER